MHKSNRKASVLPCLLLIRRLRRISGNGVGSTIINGLGALIQIVAEKYAEPGIGASFWRWLCILKRVCYSLTRLLSFPHNYENYQRRKENNVKHRIRIGLKGL